MREASERRVLKGGEKGRRRRRAGKRGENRRIRSA